MDKPPAKKTTVLIPEELWLRASHQALEERTNMRTLIVEGLELRLQRKRPIVKDGLGLLEWYEQKNREREEGGKR